MHITNRFAARELRVLIESPVENRPGNMLGTACRYAPVELPGTIASESSLLP